MVEKASGSAGDSGNQAAQAAQAAAGKPDQAAGGGEGQAQANPELSRIVSDEVGIHMRAALVTHSDLLTKKLSDATAELKKLFADSQKSGQNGDPSTDGKKKAGDSNSDPSVIRQQMEDRIKEITEDFDRKLAESNRKADDAISKRKAEKLKQEILQLLVRQDVEVTDPKIGWKVLQDHFKIDDNDVITAIAKDRNGNDQVFRDPIEFLKTVARKEYAPIFKGTSRGGSAAAGDSRGGTNGKVQLTDLSPEVLLQSLREGKLDLANVALPEVVSR